MVTIGCAHPNGFWHTWRPSGGARPPRVDRGHPPSPAYSGAPDHGSFWLVAAYTASPEALSTSPPQLWRLGKTPVTTGRPRPAVRPGRPATP